LQSNVLTCLAQSAFRRRRRSLFALSAALLLAPWTRTHAELVRARLEGVFNGSPIPAINGQTWRLDLVFDTAAPEASFTVPNPGLAFYFNTATIKAVRSLDFSVGDSGAFEIHLVDPVPLLEGDVRIDIDNFGTKTFSAHVDDVTLLPIWNGLQLDNFFLRLADGTPGGFSDGTDRLPSADPTITVDEFTAGKLLRINIGGGQLNSLPTRFELTPVPEVSPGGLCAAGTLAMFLMKRRRRLAAGDGCPV
jgi:hypothetical protein